MSGFADTDPGARAEVLDTGPPPDPAAYGGVMVGALEAGGFGGLRVARRRALAAIAARDLAGELDLPTTGRLLAGLADACLAAVISGTSLCVIGMGKLGAQELNYSSDIDLLFVGSGDEASATAARILTELGSFAPEGQAYRIDTNLRPEGRSGALVRSLEGYLEYYRRWAQPWELQALLKARFSAGDASIGRDFIEATRDSVFQDGGAERIAAIRKMKRKVEENALRSALKAGSRDTDDVKLGPGGIRDIEFSVQLLQLVHGAADETIRMAATLDALPALVSAGYIADDDGAALAVAYTWLRTVEHRLQLWQERRVRHLPSDAGERTRIARTMGFTDTPRASALELFDEKHLSVLRDVRSRFERLFYRPMIESLGGQRTMSSEALVERLGILGFRDPVKAGRILDGLVTGTTRRARLFRVLTPAVLRWLAESPSPDDGLLAFLKLGEALENRVDILGAFRDNPPALKWLADVLGSGKLLGDVLLHVPEEIAALADPVRRPAPKVRDQLIREAKASLEWRDPNDRLDGLRRFKRRELVRIAMADIGGGLEGDDPGAPLADLADSVLEAAMGDEPGMAVIAMGKLGGRELNYSSDIDVMFVHEGIPALEAERRAGRLMSAVGSVTPEGQAFRIDASLRPEGKSGPLTRSLEAFAEYYERWSSPWESLALLKARHAAGDQGLGERFLSLAGTQAYPDDLKPKALLEIRHLKARMERERIPRGVDPRRHIKMGPGSLSDIEFAIQIIQHRSGHTVPELRVTGTVPALLAARALGLISPSNAEILIDGYRWLTRLRDRAFLLAGRPVDVMPAKPEESEAVAIALGYKAQPRQELEEEYLRITRRVRRVAEPLIFGS